MTDTPSSKPAWTNRQTASPIVAKKQYVLGVDMGGTKIDAQLFEVVGGRLAEKPTKTFSVATPRGLHPNKIAMAELVAGAQSYVLDINGTLAGIGIGSPGRFSNGVIKPGTATNLEAMAGEFDNVNLQEQYQAAFAMRNAVLGATPLFVGNDATAMLAGMMENILTNKMKDTILDQFGNEVTGINMRNQRVALFGIGTGIGHTIMQVDENGGFKPVTDGHASKLRVKVDDADWPLVEKAKAALGKDVIRFDDHTVRAEDLFRGPTVEAMAGVANGRDMKDNNPEHAAAIAFAGKYMARTIALIKSGESEDVEPANGWSEADKKMAAGTNVYLIGGGMGSSPLGAAITEQAAKELARLGIGDIRLAQVKGENVAARAAAALVPETVYRGAGPRVGG